MPEMNQNGPVFDASCIRETVCVHTKKIMDSCRDKDCIEDLRVYLTRDSQACLDRATSVKARSAELLSAFVDVEPVPYNNGCYSIDITYYYKVIVDALLGAVRPGTIYGLCRFCKRVILYGGCGSAKIFTSKTLFDQWDEQQMAQCNRPQAVVEAVEPMVLSARMADANDGRRNEPDFGTLPQCISCCFDDELICSSEGRRLYVTLGQFSIVRLERDAQLLLPCCDYCFPTKECTDACGEDCNDPCEMFAKVKFPVGDFYPRGNGTGIPQQNNGCCKR